MSSIRVALEPNAVTDVELGPLKPRFNPIMKSKSVSVLVDEGQVYVEFDVVPTDADDDGFSLDEPMLDFGLLDDDHKDDIAFDAVVGKVELDGTDYTVVVNYMV